MGLFKKWVEKYVLDGYFCRSTCCGHLKLVDPEKIEGRGLFCRRCGEGKYVLEE